MQIGFVDKKNIKYDDDETFVAGFLAIVVDISCCCFQVIRLNESENLCLSFKLTNNVRASWIIELTVNRLKQLVFYEKRKAVEKSA